MRGCVCPHPPLLIPEIGGDNLASVGATVSAMKRLATELGVCELAVIVSPHTPGYADTFTVKSPKVLWGDLASFHCAQVGLEIDNDVEFVDRLVELARDEARIDVEPTDDDYLDHGVLVPMTFVRASRLVSLSVVQDYATHRTLGRLVRRCAEELGRNAVFVASGDLSHRLIPGAPAGFDERGELFDREVVALLAAGDFERLGELDGDLVRAAGECGLRSLHALGAFLADDAGHDPRVLSYEGPFGVGYAVAAFGV